MRSANVARLVATALALWLAGSVASLAQQAIDVCLKNGEVVRAQRIELQLSDGKFVVHPQGGGNAIEIAVDQIKQIGAPCAAPRLRSTTAAQKFGIYGSNTIGERLMPLLIDAFAQKKYGTREVVRPIDPEESTIEVRSSAGADPLAVIDFQSKGSGTSVKALLEKKAVIGMASRRATDEETAKVQARYNINLRAPGNEHVLALDGVAVVVHPDNPIKQLTLDQIARIFSGEIANWKGVTSTGADGRTVTGPDRPIKVHARDDKSGTYDTFVALVLAPSEGPKRKLAPQATRYESSENLSDAVAKDPGAIGFIGFPYVGKNYPLSIASTCGLTSAPAKFTVKTESYALARRLYLYTIGAPDESVARDLLQFALSDEAQPTVVEGEFIDQSIEFQDPNGQRQWRQSVVANPQLGLGADKTVPPDMIKTFDATLQGVRRSAIVFRFEYDSSDLDVRALQDIDRLARYLKSPAVAGKRVLIAGFTDTNGTWESNGRLSGQRAMRVAEELQKRGVTVPQQDVLALSHMAPVACNDTPDGQAKNRRVEIWIAQ
ncbi:MAG TPA: phosphate ABC transporter substrate-binding/OmpA family protein [Xanthobacteraceae bacterium]|nr:phosphate ABC transporter substrate-binding/OmpA family protein [Xanthobacteraceae bacterium]